MDIIFLGFSALVQLIFGIASTETKDEKLNVLIHLILLLGIIGGGLSALSLLVTGGVLAATAAGVIGLKFILVVEVIFGLIVLVSLLRMLPDD